MLKGIVFTIGIANGAYVGIKLRDSGFASTFTKNYYKNGKSQNNPILNLDPKELNELYEKGVLNTPEKLENLTLVEGPEDLERMQEFLNKERENRLAKENIKRL